MVKHIVTFQLAGTASERKLLAEQFRQALQALPGQIPVLKDIEVGVNQNPNENDDLVLIATLPSMDDVPAYANHPAHLAATAVIKGKVTHRACVDYQI